MTDSRRESLCKSKKMKSEVMKGTTVQTLNTYLMKRNCHNAEQMCQNLSLEDWTMTNLVENEVATANSFMYSCYNNDPSIKEQQFTKFIKKTLSNDSAVSQELQSFIGPLFCHLYLEILGSGHTDRAILFLQNNIPNIDLSKCDNLVKELINAFRTNNDKNNLIEIFRGNKYKITISEDAFDLLMKYLQSEHSHVALLQVLQNRFTIEVRTNDKDDEELLTYCLNESEEIHLNGHKDEAEDDPEMQELLDAFDGLNKENLMGYCCHIDKLKYNATCGVMDLHKDIAAIGLSDSTIRMQKISSLSNDFNTLIGHKDIVQDLKLVPGTESLVSVSHDKTMRLWNLESSVCQVIYQGHHYPIWCVDVSPLGVYMITGSYDKTARLWTLERTDPLRIYSAHTTGILSVKFHPNGNYFLTGSEDGVVRMWDVSPCNCVRMFVGHKGPVYSLVYSPDGKYAASAGDDKRVRVWDLILSKQLCELQTGPEITVCLDWTEKYLAAGCLNGLIRFWESNAFTSSSTSMVEPTVTYESPKYLLDLKFNKTEFTCLSASTFYKSIKNSSNVYHKI